MMTPRLSHLGLLITAAFLVTAAPAQTNDAPVPIPPQQAQNWTPPAATKLPPVVVDAATQLFKDGLADPRGCEYREIEIAMRKDWSIKAHGWVLPGDGPQKYAIGWNGLIYPVASVGAAVNIDQDFAAIKKGPGNRQFERCYWSMGGDASLNLLWARPVQVALLLRLGKTQLAEQVWTDGCNNDPAWLNKDPYADMALPWLDAWYHRAVDAFLKCDDAQALAICRQLSPVLAQVQAIAASRGIADPWPQKINGPLLWQLPALQADAARRAQETPHTPVLDLPMPLPDGPSRIASLIHDLELVHVEQVMNPGEANVAEDPVVQALIKEGQPAVEPLLDVLTSDDRLTRTRYTHHMSFDGPIVPVYECAYKALFQIFNVQYPLFEHDSTDYREQKDPRAMTSDDRARLAGKIAALWMKTQGQSLPESGYAALQDDKAGAEEWFRAIDNICQPADGTRTTYALEPPQTGYSLHMGGAPFPALGESLRAKTNPSVSALIIKRFEQLVQAQGISFDSTKLTNMLLTLADWDGKAHLADLKRLGAELDAHFLLVTGAKSGQVNVTLAERRLELGDTSALDDYLAFMQGLAPDQVKGAALAGAPGDFTIMSHYPDDPRVQKLAEKILGKGSLIVPLPNSLVPTPVLGLPAFRREFLRGLDDKSAAGTCTVETDGNMGINFTATGGGMGTVVPKGPDAPKPGTFDFRLCDNYAWDLAQIDGFPPCELYWPETKRDAASAACKTLLAQYGDALKGHPDDPYDTGVGYDPSVHRQLFRLAPRDHPATPDDVKAGRAIFSLSGPARVWKMPSYPLGSALQAEESFVDGKWQRYFGVIRDGHPVQIPAAQMEFQNTLLGSVAVTKQISGAFIGPVVSDPVFSFMYFHNRFVAAGAPLPFQIDLLNHNGEDQAIPAELLLPPHASKMLPAGLALEVSWSPKIPPPVHRFNDPDFNYGPFQPVPLRPGVTIAKPGDPGPLLAPTQTRTILQADLRDYIDFSRPGTYRLKVRFQIPNQPAAETFETTFSVAPTKP